MIKVQKVIDWFNKLYRTGAIYVWGMDGDTISATSINAAYRSFNSSKYNKAYYETKGKNRGKIGADCSGAFYKVSGFDATVAGYYSRCTKVGKIADIPANKPCVVINSTKTHIGFYCGNGYTIEMKSSADNVHKEKLNKARWCFYGIPDWIDYAEAAKKTETKRSAIPVSTYNKGSSGANVKKLQKRLKQLGYKGKNGKALSIDGIYGSNTEYAVKQFQKKNKLVVDGIVGSITIKKLNEK